MEYPDIEELFDKKTNSKSKILFYLISSLILSALVIWFCIMVFVDNESESTFYEEKVLHYLVNDQNYKRDEIKSIEEHGGIGSLPTRYVKVIFENESNIEYIYYAHNKVVQASYNPKNEKQEKLTEEDLKNFDPNGLIGS